MPDLAVVAAGSLLEFTLADHSYSMPVGRIEYFFMGPMTFEEFLQARGSVTGTRRAASSCNCSPCLSIWWTNSPVSYYSPPPPKKTAGKHTTKI